jgi:DNA (cytosine-5)-methyltransferase 1
MKILNLYAGIGGNRKAWGDENEVTAIEYDEKIANIYKKYYPNDNVIVTDAHQYLLEHFREFDFIWASPPCPTHSRVRKQLAFKKKKDGTIFEQNKPVYPDMTLYQEIIFLDNYFDGLYVVENVIPYYEPLIEPQKLGRHLFWSNVELPQQKFEARGSFDDINQLAKKLNYNYEDLKGVNKILVLRNCVENEISDYIYQKIKAEYNKEKKDGNF